MSGIIITPLVSLQPTKKCRLKTHPLHCTVFGITDGVLFVFITKHD